MEENDRRWRLHVGPRWDDVPLTGAHSEDVQAWVNALAKKYSPVYVEDIYKTFAAVMAAAVDRQPPLLQFTPCCKIRLVEAGTHRGAA